MKALQKEENILLAYLFGSRSQGSPGTRSDVDVAIYLRKMPRNLLHYELKLAGRLSEAAHDEVDLSILNVAPPLLKYQVIKKGRMLHCNDERERVSFESRTLDEYLDHDRISARYFAHFMRRRT